MKSVERLVPVHGKQLLTYIRLAQQPVGLLMNFGGATFREGLQRIVNGPADILAFQLTGVNSSSSWLPFFFVSSCEYEEAQG